MTRKRRLLLVAATALAGWVGPAWPEEPKPELKTNQFDYQYVEPTNPAHLPIYKMLKEAQLLEKMQQFLSPFRLPLKITLKLEGCNGVINAYFQKDMIKICYEYIEYLQKRAAKMPSQLMTPRDALIGPTVEVFLHETGHAVVQTLDIPYFGSEEDVADYFATYILLHFAKDDARRLILGAAKEEQTKAPELWEMGDVHGLPAQRYFGIWCMAYGYDPVLYGDAVKLGMLPENRAKRCKYEYWTNEFAFKKLILPYVDDTLKEKVMTKNWFQFESPVAPAVTAPAQGPQQDERKSTK
jgi:hypothetical protein